MHYQVSRNGQTYGPYTLEDLGRYVASGNVLPTDLAKSEEMSEWLPVAQILSGQSAPAAGAGYPAAGFAPDPASPFAHQPGHVGQSGQAAQPPYAAPYQAAAGSPYPDPPNLHWGIYLLLAIVTCTLFSKVFTVVQAVWLRRVQPNSNGLFFYIAYYVLWFVSLFAGTGEMVRAFSHPGMMPHRSPGHSALSLLVLILLIVTRFVMSASLEEHFNGPEPIGLKLNPVLVFFFGGVYFQSQFNRINALKLATRTGAPRLY